MADYAPSDHPTPFDPNANNYSITELFQILGFNDENDPRITIPAIYELTQQHIDLTKRGHPSSSTTLHDPVKRVLAAQKVLFFQDLRDLVLDFLEGGPVAQEEEEEAEEEGEVEVEVDRDGQEEKFDEDADNLQPLREGFDNNDNPEKESSKMSDKDLSPKTDANVPHEQSPNLYVKPVAPDKLNPTLTNTITRMLHINSAYRDFSTSGQTSNDFVFELTEPLLNVLSMRIYSVAFPVTWYNINSTKQNNSFVIKVPHKISITISIPFLNYNVTTIVAAIQKSLTDAGITAPKTPTAPMIQYNQGTGLFSFCLFKCKFTPPPETGLLRSIEFDATSQLVFFDPTQQESTAAFVKINSAASFRFLDGTDNAAIDLSNNSLFMSPTSFKACENNNTGSSKQQAYVNTTLGWVLGFRVFSAYLYDPTTNDPADVVTAQSVGDLYGTKSIMICLDDFQSNRLNVDVIGIHRHDSKLKLPSYYSPDLLQRLGATPNHCTSHPFDAPANSATHLAKSTHNPSYRGVPLITAQSPRNLTFAQIYSINEILKNNAQSVDYRPKFSKHTDTLAVIPIKLGGNSQLGDVYTEFGGSIQDNKRSYFGPVTISRMRMRLFDDMGDLVDLNGADWTVLILVDQLYQY